MADSNLDAFLEKKQKDLKMMLWVSLISIVSGILFSLSLYFYMETLQNHQMKNYKRSQDHYKQMSREMLLGEIDRKDNGLWSEFSIFTKLAACSIFFIFAGQGFTLLTIYWDNKKLLQLSKK